MTANEDTPPRSGSPAGQVLGPQANPPVGASADVEKCGAITTVSAGSPPSAATTASRIAHAARSNPCTAMMTRRISWPHACTGADAQYWNGRPAIRMRWAAPSPRT